MAVHANPFNEELNSRSLWELWFGDSSGNVWLISSEVRNPNFSTGLAREM